jgi:hypothetical protein
MGMLLGQIHNNYQDIHPPLAVDMHVSQVAISEVRSQASLGSNIVLCLLQPGLQSTLRQSATPYRHRYSLPLPVFLFCAQVRG